MESKVDKREDLKMLVSGCCNEDDTVQMMEVMVEVDMKMLITERVEVDI